MTRFSAQLVRTDIPQLRRQVFGRPLTYLDSGATSLTPRCVIDAMSQYYETHHANVHRAVYQTAAEATATYEEARLAIGRFINAADPANEVIFTKNATESFNLLAKSWGATHLRPGDVVLASEMEHHANIVPWFQLAASHGIEVRFIPVTDDFRLDLSSIDALMEGVKLISVTGMSNVLGTINPIAALATLAHAHGAKIAVDGAQSVAHGVVDVQALDIDMLAFSGHKMMGPTGIGVLWVRRDVIDTMPAFLGGGGMIADVTTEGWTPASGIARFEAGTPMIAEAAGLTAAVRYLEALGMENIASHEEELTRDALSRLASHFGGRVRIIGPGDTDRRGGVISLDVEGVHPHDVAQVLDQFGVCVRPGHHCAKPLMRRFGLAATARASFGPYNLTSDTDVLLEALAAAIEMFG